MTPELLVNDVHAQLNATPVARLVRPTSTDEVAALVREAGAANVPVSLCGARHAMGGQQFGAETWLLDLRGLVGTDPVDRERGLVEVGAGTTWPALIAGLHAGQAGASPVWSIR